MLGGAVRVQMLWVGTGCLCVDLCKEHKVDLDSFSEAPWRRRNGAARIAAPCERGSSLAGCSSGSCDRRSAAVPAQCRAGQRKMCCGVVREDPRPLLWVQLGSCASRVANAGVFRKSTRGVAYFVNDAAILRWALAVGFCSKGHAVVFDRFVDLAGGVRLRTSHCCQCSRFLRALQGFRATLPPVVAIPAAQI